MHTMWKGTISFGLVNIPVKMHAATENKDVKLRQLHKECKTPIKYEKVCPVCDRKVEENEIVRAYEYTKNKFVVVEDEDLKEIQKEQGDKAVEIIDFVKLEEIDPIYFDKSYYLSPNEGGMKAYSLLRTIARFPLTSMPPPPKPVLSRPTLRTGKPRPKCSSLILHALKSYGKPGYSLRRRSSTRDTRLRRTSSRSAAKARC